MRKQFSRDSTRDSAHCYSRKQNKTEMNKLQIKVIHHEVSLKLQLVWSHDHLVSPLPTKTSYFFLSQCTGLPLSTWRPDRTRSPGSDMDQDQNLDQDSKVHTLF